MGRAHETTSCSPILLARSAERRVFYAKYREFDSHVGRAPTHAYWWSITSKFPFQYATRFISKILYLELMIRTALCLWTKRTDFSYFYVIYRRKNREKYFAPNRQKCSIFSYGKCIHYCCFCFMYIKDYSVDLPLFRPPCSQNSVSMRICSQVPLLRKAYSTLQS